MAPQEESGLLKDAPSLGHLPHRAEIHQERGVSDASRETSGLWYRLGGRHRDARTPHPSSGGATETNGGTHNILSFF